MYQAIELDSQQSSRVLQCACRAGAEISMRPKAWASAQTVHGRLRDGGEEQTLKVEIERCADGLLGGLVNMYCEFELLLSDGRYQFDSHVLGVRERHPGAQLSVAWPYGILVHQRRRSTRLAVASSADVQLSRQEDGRLLSCRGRLYNLSSEGVAFQLLETDAGQLQPGQQWWVCFEIPEQGHHYKLRARVSRKLPSAEQDAAIIGMEFEPDAAGGEDMQRLSDYLEQRQSSSSAMGVRP